MKYEKLIEILKENNGLPYKLANDEIFIQEMTMYNRVPVLEYATDRVKADKTTVLISIDYFPETAVYASEKLKNDPDVLKLLEERLMKRYMKMEEGK